MRRFGLVTSLLLVGCGSDPGSVLVSWKVGLSSNCAEAGIETIQITLTEEGGSTIGPLDAACSAGEDGATFKIDDVDEGSYSITLAGLNAADETIYTGQSSSRVSVSEGKASTPATITLSPAPASLRINWRFLDGLGCAAQVPPATDVTLVLFKSNSEEATESTECDASFFVFQDLEADDDYDVQVTASGGGDDLYQFEILDISLDDGEQATETGDLLACSPTCN